MNNIRDRVWPLVRIINGVRAALLFLAAIVSIVVKAFAATFALDEKYQLALASAGGLVALLAFHVLSQVLVKHYMPQLLERPPLRITPRLQFTLSAGRATVRVHNDSGYSAFFYGAIIAVSGCSEVYHPSFDLHWDGSSRYQQEIIAKRSHVLDVAIAERGGTAPPFWWLLLLYPALTDPSYRDRRDPRYGRWSGRDRQGRSARADRGRER